MCGSRGRSGINPAVQPTETVGMLQLKITFQHDLTSAIQLKEIREHRLNDWHHENNSAHVMFTAKIVEKWRRNETFITFYLLYYIILYFQVNIGNIDSTRTEFIKSFLTV